MNAKDLLNLLQPGKSKKLETNLFTIENQVLKSDVFFVPLSSITSVSKTGAVLKNPMYAFISLIIGIILMLTPIPALITIGSFLLLYAIIFFIIWVIKLLNRDYFIIIRLNNGSSISFSNKSERYIYDLMNDMRLCFEDREKTLVANIKIGEIKIKVDNSTGKTITKNNYSAGDMTINGSKNVNITYALSDNDMEVLKQLFTFKTKITDSTDKNYKFYKTMKGYCDNDNKEKVIQSLKAVGKSAFKIILQGVGAELAKATMQVISHIF